jgi:type II secretion system protein N
MRFAKRLRKRASNGTPVARKPHNLYRSAGLGLFLLGLLCSFYLAFPDTVLRERLVHELEARLPIQVELAEAGLRPLLTLAGEQATISFTRQPGVLFHIESFNINPKWISLFTGNPGLEGALRSAAGELSFSWQSNGPLFLAGTDLPFDIPLKAGSPMRFVGTLATGEVTTTVPLQKTTESLIDITLDQIIVQGLAALTSNADGFRLGSISLQMTGRGTSFSIEKLEARGGDLEVTGEGTLMFVAANPQNSRLNLNLTVRAGSRADPTLASLLELAGTQQSDGSRKLRLTGTLAKPVIR